MSNTEKFSTTVSPEIAKRFRELCRGWGILPEEVLRSGIESIVKENADESDAAKKKPTIIQFIR